MDTWVGYVLSFAGALILVSLAITAFFVKLWMKEKADRIKFNKERIEYLEGKDKGQDEQFANGRTKFENHNGRISLIEADAIRRPEFEDYKEENKKEHVKLRKSVDEVTASVGVMSRSQDAIAGEVRGGIKAMTNIAANMVDREMARKLPKRKKKKTAKKKKK